MLTNASFKYSDLITFYLSVEANLIVQQAVYPWPVGLNLHPPRVPIIVKHNIVTYMKRVFAITSPKISLHVSRKKLGVFFDISFCDVRYEYTSTNLIHDR